MKGKIYVFSVLVFVITQVNSLDNGLALTPPMGWLAWERFRCIIDCETFPDDCINEKLFTTMADLLVSEGYSELGYKYVNIDDCYLEKRRDKHGTLQPDHERFPNGIRYLSNYMHKKDLKLGVYEDYGTKTCAGYPGILGHMKQDAETFAEWNVDMLKLDGCYSNITDMDKGYPEMGEYLNQTGHPILYSCSWPCYQAAEGMKPNYTAIAEYCNIWRNFDDIQDSWESVESIIDYYGDNQETLVPHAGSGHWNDPDMLIIGNYGLSYDQSKAQMALWAILAAPLFMSNDLRVVEPEYKAILQNRHIIAVNQDPLGKQGKRIFKNHGIEIWLKPITPTIGEYFSYGIAILNRNTDGAPKRINVLLGPLGLTCEAGYHVQDLYSNEDHGHVGPSDTLKVDVNPTGIVMLRAEVNS